MTPDVAGIYSALARRPGITPAERRHYRFRASVVRASNAMRAGNRVHTRPLRPRRGHDGWKRQARDHRGRWCTT